MLYALSLYILSLLLVQSLRLHIPFYIVKYENIILMLHVVSVIPILNAFVGSLGVGYLLTINYLENRRLL